TARRGGLLHRITQSGSGVLAYFAGVPLAFCFIAALGPVGVVTVLLKHFGVDLYAHGFTISSMIGVGLCYVYFQIPLMIILITPALEGLDRKSTRLNSSHVAISYAVFCLKKKKKVYSNV